MKGDAKEVKKVKKAEKKEVKLYTLSALVGYCNAKFGRKESGKGFTAQDIQGYINRGGFPKKLGGQKIVRWEDKSIVGTVLYQLKEQ